MNHSIFSYRKVYGYIVLILMILVMSWEMQKVDAALHMENIPEESIRLRILANSDSPRDQYIKAIVRDNVVATMNSWVTEPISVEQAREMLQEREAELQTVIATTLKKYGYTYGFTTTIGQVEFPTKMYGQLVYPAGMYEALLITLGQGEGRNWWCVLFPPLCFTDAVAGEATAGATVAASENSKQQAESADNKVKEQSVVIADNSTENKDTTEVEVKFFIVELFENFGSWLGSLFA